MKKINMILSIVLSYSSILAFVFGMSSYKDNWPASYFVLLVYSIFINTIIATTIHFYIKKTEKKTLEVKIGVNAWLIWLWIANILLFSWIFIPQSKDIVGWFIRKLTVLWFSE